MRIDNYTYNYVKEVLEALYDYKPFRDFMECSSEDTWYRANDLFSGMEIGYTCGATKGVLILDDIDWVIKMPFLWEIEHEWVNGSRTPKENRKFHGEDYCKLEWRNYLLAQKADLAQCFAATDYWGEFHGYPIYLQEKVDCDEYRVSDSMSTASYHDWLDEMGYEDNEENHDDFYDNYYYDDGDELAEALVYEAWDSRTASEFLEFCEGWEISDKHSGNFGYAGDDLVIVDYSGYGSWFTETQHNGWDDICKDALARRAA